MTTYRRLSLLLCLLLAATLLTTACKPSPKLEKVTYQQNSSDVDKNNDTKFMHNDAKNQDVQDNLAPMDKEDDAKDARDREREKSVYGNENVNDHSQTPSVDYDPLTHSNQTAENNQSDQTENNDEAPLNGGGQGQNSGGQNQGQDGTVKDGAGGTDGQGNQGMSPTPSDTAMKTIVLPNGEQVQIPENVDRVSAPSELGLLVQMLGGSGRLVASSANFTGNSLASAVFSDEGIGKVTSLWEGDGSGQISDSNFNALLNLKPDVCFEVSGQNTFSAAQIATLKEKQIGYVVLPKMNTSVNVNTCVQVVGQVLGDKSSSGGENAVSNAERYIDYYDSTIKEVSQKSKRFTYQMIDFDNDKNLDGVKTLSSGDIATQGLYSLYIANWDDSADCRIYSGSVNELQTKGAAVVKSGYSYSSISYFMSLNGVLNLASIYPDYHETKNWYVNPLHTVQWNIQLTGTGGELTSNSLTVSATDPTITIGTPSFNKMVVASNDIKEKMQNSRFWNVYPKVTSEGGTIQDYGFLDSNGRVIGSYIKGDYTLLVNPSGVGDWAGTSVESILEPVWLSWKYQDGYTEAQVRDKIAAFYKDFYRCSLTNDQITTIMNGK